MPADRRISPMWVAHHYPEDYDRCVLVGRTHVCRRCVVLYPLAFAVMAAGLVGTWAAGPLAAVALVVLPLPAVIEFALEHRGRLSYRPARQMAVTVPLAVGLGIGFARYLRHPADWLFWAVVVVYTGVCVAAAWWPRH